MVQKLQSARRDLSLPAMLDKLDKFDLIVLDDLSYVRKDQVETSALFELIAHRYERHSLAITANQPFSAWDNVFPDPRSEEHTSELQSLMRISYAVFCLKKKKKYTYHTNTKPHT